MNTQIAEDTNNVMISERFVDANLQRCVNGEPKRVRAMDNTQRHETLIQWPTFKSTLDQHLVSSQLPGEMR